MPAAWDPPLADEPPWPVLGDGPFLLLVDAESTIERELIKGYGKDKEGEEGKPKEKKREEELIEQGVDAIFKIFKPK